MLINRVYREVQNGNYYVELWLSEEKNNNTICIHDNSMGETIFECSSVWDTDLFKIVRVLNKYKYSHTMKIQDVVKKINRVSRHLKIDTYLF